MLPERLEPTISNYNAHQPNKEMVATAGMTLEAIQNSRICQSLKNSLEATPDPAYQYIYESQHSVVVYHSFVSFCKTCLGKQGFDSLQGLFQKRFKNCKEIKDQLQIVSKRILENKLMKENDKAQFICDLKKEEFLVKLILQLQIYFSDCLLHELITIIFEIWQHYLVFKKNLLGKCKIGGLVICPKVKNFDLYEPESSQIKEQCSDTLEQEMNKLFTDQNRTQIIEAADSIVGQITKQFFFSKDIIKLTLQQFRLEKEVSDDFALSQFQKFIRNVCRAVYLAVENYFQHPDYREESQSIKSQLQKERFDSDDQDLINKSSQKKRKM